MTRSWTRIHAHLGAEPGPLTFDMVRRATEDQLQEFDDLDWKEQLPQPPREGRWNELAKDVAAMANTRGGLLVFGVQDKPIELVGVPADANTEQYHQWIRNHVHPYLPDLDMFALTDGDKTVLVVDVPASESAPHLVYGTAARDKEQQAAVGPYRANDHTAWMAEHQLERAYRERFARIGLAPAVNGRTRKTTPAGPHGGEPEPRQVTVCVIWTATGGRWGRLSRRVRRRATDGFEVGQLRAWRKVP